MRLTGAVEERPICRPTLRVASRSLGVVAYLSPEGSFPARNFLANRSSTAPEPSNGYELCSISAPRVTLICPQYFIQHDHIDCVLCIGSCAPPLVVKQPVSHSLLAVEADENRSVIQCGVDGFKT